MKILNSFLFILTLLFSQDVTIKELDPSVKLFFNALRYKADYINDYIEKTPKWGKNRFSKYISPTDGLEIKNVNKMGTIKVFFKKEIEKQIKQRRGEAFSTLAHLSYIYNAPKNQDNFSKNLIPTAPVTLSYIFKIFKINIHRFFII